MEYMSWWVEYICIHFLYLDFPPQHQDAEEKATSRRAGSYCWVFRFSHKNLFMFPMRTNVYVAELSWVEPESRSSGAAGESKLTKGFWFLYFTVLLKTSVFINIFRNFHFISAIVVGGRSMCRVFTYWNGLMERLLTSCYSSGCCAVVSLFLIRFDSIRWSANECWPIQNPVQLDSTTHPIPITISEEKNQHEIDNQTNLRLSVLWLSARIWSKRNLYLIWLLVHPSIQRSIGIVQHHSQPAETEIDDDWIQCANWYITTLLLGWQWRSMNPLDGLPFARLSNWWGRVAALVVGENIITYNLKNKILNKLLFNFFFFFLLFQYTFILFPFLFYFYLQQLLFLLMDRNETNDV